MYVLSAPHPQLLLLLLLLLHTDAVHQGALRMLAACPTAICCPPALLISIIISELSLLPVGLPDHKHNCKDTQTHTHTWSMERRRKAAVVVVVGKPDNRQSWRAGTRRFCCCCCGLSAVWLCLPAERWEFSCNMATLHACLYLQLIRVWIYICTYNVWATQAQAKVKA